MSCVLTRIDEIQGIVVANIGRLYPLIRSQGGLGVAIASRSTGRETGAIALPFGSHPKALSPQRLWNLLRLRQGTPKMDYSCQNPHGVPQGFRQANCLAWRLRDRQASGLPWAEGWRSCQMRGRSAVLRCLRRVRRSEEQGPRSRGCDRAGVQLQPRLLRLNVLLRGRLHALRARSLLPPSRLPTIRCTPRLASHPGKPSARPCGTYSEVP